MHYTNYLKYINNISQLITHGVCGQLYSQIVKILYQQCKCESTLDYVQKFIQSSCMKYFQCTVVDQIRYLQQSGILQLTHLENIFIQHVANYHCKIPTILSTVPFLLFPIKLFCNPRMTTFNLIVVVVVSMSVYNVGTGMYLQELGPIPLWFRCVSSGLALKWICHTCVQISLAYMSICIFKSTSNIVSTNKCLPQISTVVFLTLYFMFLLLLHYFGVFVKVSIHCCHFLSMC